MTIDCLNSYPLPDLEAVDKALAAELARDGHKGTGGVYTSTSPPHIGH